MARRHPVFHDLSFIVPPLCRNLGTLSGGQVVSLGLDARHKLYAVLGDFTGCLLLGSHGRALLDGMERIAELGSDELRLYGGDFTETRRRSAPSRRSSRRTSAMPSRS